jgi:hypothetical protein
MMMMIRQGVLLFIVMWFLLLQPTCQSLSFSRLVKGKGKVHYIVWVVNAMPRPLYLGEREPLPVV